MNSPAYRNLRGYTLDPGFSIQLDTIGINETTYRIRWEELKPGPTGNYIEVIDYDPASNCYYAPVDLNGVNVLSQNGLNPSEGNPQFHQQFVYVIAMRTIECFEQSLGRKIIWRPRRPMTELPKEERYEKEYVGTLRIYPHALREANAYFDPERKAVLFGYFSASSDNGNLPGGVVFTCLSPDIVSHEVTHAILDSIHPRFIENTNPDVPAFHEAFADIISLLQRFTIRDLVEHQIAKTKGRLDEFNLLGELATQFGNALEGGRGALRSAIGKMENGKWKKFDPDPSAYQTTFEPHARGAILVATIFDSFLRLYLFKIQDLIRIATNGSGIWPQGDISIDLVKRLAAEATETARHLLQICIRALDYCPPVDITFGDYLRALITADLNVAPADTMGYRITLIEAFRAWGIFPDRVNTLSPESLEWSRNPFEFGGKEKKILLELKRRLKREVSHLLGILDRKELAIKTRKVQAALHVFLEKQHKEMTPDEWDGFLKRLGLSSQDVYFDYNGRRLGPFRPQIEVHAVRPAYRIGREGVFSEQVVITLTQTINIVNDAELNNVKFRGGCTMILDMSNDYNIKYIIVKNIASQYRFETQMNYKLGKTTYAYALASNRFTDSFGEKHNIQFSALHFHGH